MRTQYLLHHHNESDPSLLYHNLYCLKHHSFVHCIIEAYYEQWSYSNDKCSIDYQNGKIFSELHMKYIILQGTERQMFAKTLNFKFSVTVI